MEGIRKGFLFYAQNGIQKRKGPELPVLILLVSPLPPPFLRGLVVINFENDITLEILCSAARETKINGWYVLTCTSQYSLQYLKFPRFVSNVNLKSTGIESKNVGKDDIKLNPSGLFRPTRSSSLSHWLNPRSSSTFNNDQMIYGLVCGLQC